MRSSIKNIMPTLAQTSIRTHKYPLIAWLLLSALSLIWGSSFLLIKKGLEVFTPFQVASLRIAAAFIVVAIPFWWHFRKVSLQKWGFLLLSGLLGNLIPAFLFAIAQTQINSSVASILNSLTPFFTFLVGVVFFRKKALWQKAFGIFLGIIGTLLIFYQKGNLQFNAYALLIVGATLGYGFNVNLTGKFLADVKPIHITTISIFMVGAIANIILFGFTDFLSTLQSHSKGYEALTYILILGVVGSGISSILFYKLLQVSSPLFASSVTYVIPLVGVSWGLLSGETITPAHLAGMSLIIAGVVVMNKYK
ncbi:MAG: EamA family transporter [Raineya sp.]|nr:DMT family transporter [Raineya sp.]MDW8296127.1 EamA family transporter [Raineya sp.]